MPDRLAELLYLTDEEIANYENSPRDCCDLLNKDPVEERPCRAGNCVEFWCPCGTPRGMGYGPVGCPCEVEVED